MICHKTKPNRVSQKPSMYAISITQLGPLRHWTINSTQQADITWGEGRLRLGDQFLITYPASRQGGLLKGFREISASLNNVQTHLGNKRQKSAVWNLCIMLEEVGVNNNVNTFNTFKNSKTKNKFQKQEKIFIIKGFWTIVFIFIVIFHNISADMSSGLFHVFVELGNLHGTSNYILYWIHRGGLFWFH